jgi:hypothetical protein
MREVVVVVWEESAVQREQTEEVAVQVPPTHSVEPRIHLQAVAVVHPTQWAIVLRRLEAVRVGGVRLVQDSQVLQTQAVAVVLVRMEQVVQVVLVS